VEKRLRRRLQGGEAGAREVTDIYAKHRLARIRWLGRLKGHRFVGVYFSYDDMMGGTVPVKPWRFGWERSQMYESLSFGPGYLLWTWA
jgi:hypothetical protein